MTAPETNLAFDRDDALLIALTVTSTTDAATAAELADLEIASFDFDPWPNALIGKTWFLGSDAPLFTTYEQWGTAEASNPAASEDVLPLRRIRSLRKQPAGTPPGCIVVAHIRFDGAIGHQAHDWIGTAFAGDALDQSHDDDPAGPMAGLIAAHFHASDDGTHMVNIAEWCDADAHRRMMADAASAAAADQPDPAEAIHTFPGMVDSSVTRYHIAGHRARPTKPDG